MKANPKQIEAMCGLLTRLYQEIYPLEAEHGILVGEDDLRPRIEHFHDAVRALLAQGAKHEHTGRLSLDRLAYDVNILRDIQARPLTPLKGRPGEHSAETPKSKGGKGRSLVAAGQQPHGMKPPNSSTESELASLYKKYGVFYVALFAESADRDYKSQSEKKDSEVEGLSDLKRQIEMMMKKKGEEVEVDLEAMAKSVDDSSLQHKILFMIHVYKQKRRQQAQDAILFLKNMMRQSDKELAVVEKMHMAYLTTQLSMYEQSRDIVKKMAAQGLNIAGEFVQGAMAEAQRGMRGR